MISRPWRRCWSRRVAVTPQARPWPSTAVCSEACASDQPSQHPQHGRVSMPTDRLVPGLKAELVVTVDDKLVVKHMGGEGVLSTPAMIGLMERAGIEAVQAQLPDGHTTVGFEVNVKHFAATPK